jgi:hypothetical protein
MANTEQTSPTKQVIEEYRKNELTPKKTTAEAERDAADTRIEGSASNRQYKICAYVEGQRVSDFYNTLDFCEAIAAVSTSGQVSDRIKKVETKNGDLKKQFDEVVKAIKDLRVKLYDVEMKALDMADAYEDPSNADQIKALPNSIDKARVTLMVDVADKTHDQSNTAFSTAVDVAGIMTFTNIESLKGFGDNLSKKAVDFKKNVDDNVKKSNEDRGKAQQELGEASKILMLDTFGRKDPSVEIMAWKATDTFLGDGSNAKCVGSIEEVNGALKELADNYEHVGGITLEVSDGRPPKPRKNFDLDR